MGPSASTSTMTYAIELPQGFACLFLGHSVDNPCRRSQATFQVATRVGERPPPSTMMSLACVRRAQLGATVPPPPEQSSGVTALVDIARHLAHRRTARRRRPCD